MPLSLWSNTECISELSMKARTTCSKQVVDQFRAVFTVSPLLIAQRWIAKLKLEESSTSSTGKGDTKIVLCRLNLLGGAIVSEGLSLTSSASIHNEVLANWKVSIRYSHLEEIGEMQNHGWEVSELRWCSMLSFRRDWVIGIFLSMCLPQRSLSGRAVRMDMELKSSMTSSSRDFWWATELTTSWCSSSGEPPRRRANEVSVLLLLLLSANAPTKLRKIKSFEKRTTFMLAMKYLGKFWNQWKDFWGRFRTCGKESNTRIWKEGEKSQSEAGGHNSIIIIAYYHPLQRTSISLQTIPLSTPYLIKPVDRRLWEHHDHHHHHHLVFTWHLPTSKYRARSIFCEHRIRLSRWQKMFVTWEEDHTARARVRRHPSQSNHWILMTSFYWLNEYQSSWLEAWRLTLTHSHLSHVNIVS